MPLEVLVEREPPVAPTLRQRLDAWTRLVELLDAAGLGARAADLAAAHPLPPPRPRRTWPTSGCGCSRARAGDGVAAAAALAADAAGLPADLVAAFVAWVGAQAAAGAGTAG